MTLGEFLDKQDPETVLYIGANGGNFFFIGTKDQYQKDIPDIEKQLYKTALKRLNESRSQFIDYLGKGTIPIQPIDFKSWTDGLLPDAVKRYERHAQTAAINAIQRFKTVQKSYITALNRMRKQHFPLTDREVLDVTEKILPDEAGYAVIISGDESGRYWFRKEYDQKFIYYGTEEGTYGQDTETS